MFGATLAIKLYKTLVVIIMYLHVHFVMLFHAFAGD